MFWAEADPAGLLLVPWLWWHFKGEKKLRAGKADVIHLPIVQQISPSEGERLSHYLSCGPQCVFSHTLVFCVCSCLCIIIFMCLHYQSLNLGIRHFIFHNSIDKWMSNPRLAVFFENQEDKLCYWVLSQVILLLARNTCSFTKLIKRLSTKRHNAFWGPLLRSRFWKIPEIYPLSSNVFYSLALWMCYE